jgi:hypothetical protein
MSNPLAGAVEALEAAKELLVSSLHEKLTEAEVHDQITLTNAALSALKEAGEPVAWRWSIQGAGWIYGPDKPHSDWETIEPLYTAPRPPSGWDEAVDRDALIAVLAGAQSFADNFHNQSLAVPRELHAAIPKVTTLLNRSLPREPEAGIPAGWREKLIALVAVNRLCPPALLHSEPQGDGWRDIEALRQKWTTGHGIYDVLDLVTADMQAQQPYHYDEPESYRWNDRCYSIAKDAFNSTLRLLFKPEAMLPPPPTQGLLPCPFCGRHFVLNHASSGGAFWAHDIAPDEMKCWLDESSFPNVPKDIEEWNTRAALPASSGDEDRSFAASIEAKVIGTGDLFAGDDETLIRSIEAILSLDKANALAPHGIGGHAHVLLSAVTTRFCAVLSTSAKRGPPNPTEQSSSPADVGIVCADCSRLYGDEHGFPDLVIDHAAWRTISPDGEGNGMLCPSCICGRLHKAGLEQVVGTFRSGPLCDFVRPDTGGGER